MHGSSNTAAGKFLRPPRLHDIATVLAAHPCSQSSLLGHGVTSLHLRTKSFASGVSASGVAGLRTLPVHCQKLRA